MPVKTKTPLDQTLLNTVKQTPYLQLDSEKDKGTNAEILKGKAVVIIDPATGNALGASDFFHPPINTKLTVTQALPVQNVWYPVLTATDIDIKLLAVSVADTGETLQVRATIDGNVFTGVATACNAGEYVNSTYVRGNNGAILMVASAVNAEENTSIANNGTLRGHDVFVEMRKTTAAGAGTITAMMHYLEY